MAWLAQRGQGSHPLPSPLTTAPCIQAKSLPHRCLSTICCLDVKWGRGTCISPLARSDRKDARRHPGTLLSCPHKHRLWSLSQLSSLSVQGTEGRSQQEHDEISKSLSVIFSQVVLYFGRRFGPVYHFPFLGESLQRRVGWYAWPRRHQWVPMLPNI